MNSHPQQQDKASLTQQFDRQLDWIKSCDTKSSIVLAVVGIFLTVFTAEHSINMLNDIVSKSIHNINFSNVLYLLGFSFFLCLFVYGAYCLIRVLTPRLSKDTLSFEGTERDSLYFFESIAKNTFNDYKDKVLNRSNNEQSIDLLSQTYINAKICTIKYAYYSKGIKFTFIGITGILVLYIIGIVLIKMGGFN
ncbi:Pycsar system effector family protein [Paenibacillus sp. FSL H8-0283]|uniref:Pycsar system effector family protein n=1 Tax=Paenibacillus sp. FSL H8-0283 TaxID=2921383 RepID=UPI00324EE455